MKIAIAVERFDQHGGGLEQWTWSLVHTLAERGHRLTVLAFRAPAQPASPAITLLLMPWHPSRLVRTRTADAMITSLDADVVHDLGVASSADVTQPQAGCRIANQVHELESLTPLQRFFARMRPRRRRWLNELRQFEQSLYIGNSSSLVIAVSQMVATDLNHWYGVAAERIRLIPNGVDTARFQSPSADERSNYRRQFQVSDKTVFLFAAHNPRLKGLPFLFQAFARAKACRPDLKLMILGKAPSKESLRTVRKLQIENDVLFPGFVADSVPYFAAADTFVLPTWHDACSLTVLEACACGLPVITTRRNGASELLLSGREGRILDRPSNVDDLTAALIELSNPEVRAQMAGHARQLAAHHNFQTNVDAIERVYLELQERKHNARRISSRATS